MADKAMLRVEVVFATPIRQALIALELPAGATVADAIETGLARTFSDQSLSPLQAGIWGKPVERSTRLQDGDRVELYRPLPQDPREARRVLAANGK